LSFYSVFYYRKLIPANDISDSLASGLLVRFGKWEALVENWSAGRWEKPRVLLSLFTLL
jgi:hypothetical protein